MSVVPYPRHMTATQKSYCRLLRATTITTVTSILGAVIIAGAHPIPWSFAS